MRCVPTKMDHRPISDRHSEPQQTQHRSSRLQPDRIPNPIPTPTISIGYPTLWRRQVALRPRRRAHPSPDQQKKAKGRPWGCSQIRGFAARSQIFLLKQQVPHCLLTVFLTSNQELPLISLLYSVLRSTSLYIPAGET